MWLGLLVGWAAGAPAAGPAEAFGPQPGFLLQEAGAATPSGDALDEAAPAPPAPEQVVVQLKPKKPGYFDAPGWVMARSAVIPGWGQLHNGSWIKALVIGGGEVWLALRAWDTQKQIDDLAAQIDVAREIGDPELEQNLIEQHNSKLDELIARQWWLGAMIGYSLLDAYIDAHFRDFGVGFETDKALPEGKPSKGGKLFLRWTF